MLWQDKAWIDRPLAEEWAEDVIKPFMKAERRAGVARADTRYLLFQDNLDAQKQPGYLNKLRACGVDDHKLPPNETDQVQPIDRGLGRQVKIYLGHHMDECWTMTTVSLSGRRMPLPRLAGASCSPIGTLGP